MGITRHNMVIIKWRKNEKTTFVTYFLQKMNKKSSIREIIFVSYIFIHFLRYQKLTMITKNY